MNAKKLTDRQSEVLSFIEDAIGQWGYPPTVVELCYAFGWKSPNAAVDHLRALERKGFIERDRNTARGLRVLISAESAA